MLGAARDYIWNKVNERYPEEQYGSAVVDQIGEEVFGDVQVNDKATSILESLGHRHGEEPFSEAWEDFDQDVVEIFESGQVDEEINQAMETIDRLIQKEEL